MFHSVVGEMEGLWSPAKAAQGLQGQLWDPKSQQGNDVGSVCN